MFNFKSKSIFKFFVPIVVLMVFVVPVFVMAQGAGGQPDPGAGGGSTDATKGGYKSGEIKIVNPFKKDTIQGLIETIVKDILMPVGAVVAVIMIMYAGFLFVTAKGDPGQITKAKDALLYAVIGAAILLGAWIISEAIGTTINQLKIS